MLISYHARQDFRNVILSVNSKESSCVIFILCFKIWDTYIKQNEVEEPRYIPYYGKKSNDSIVHYNDAAYSKLHVLIVYNIINILICE